MKKHKVKIMGNGKLVLMDFKKLNPKTFYPVHNYTKNEIKNQYCLCTPTGKLYVNNSFEISEHVAGIMELLMQETRETIIQYQEAMQKKFPNIKKIEDLGNVKMIESDTIHAMAMLFVPLELARRDIEKNYYNMGTCN